MNQWIKDSRTGEASDDREFGFSYPGTSDASPQHIWARNYYEHVVRNQPELERIRQYIAGNPDQWTTDEENPKR